MSISFLTDQPSDLLASIKRKIDQGEVQTWAYDDAGDFTHTPPQWKHKAWLMPVEQDDRLTLRILKRNDEELSWTTYAVYHGRFLEMMIKHCRRSYKVARCPSTPLAGDAVPVID